MNDVHDLRRDVLSEKLHDLKGEAIRSAVLLTLQVEYEKAVQMEAFGAFDIEAVMFGDDKQCH